MDIVAIRLKTAILSSATDLQLQAYWLSTSLALGAFLRVRSIGKRDVGNMFKFGDDMINFVALHGMLAESVADVVVVDINVLLGQVRNDYAHSTYTVHASNLLMINTQQPSCTRTCLLPITCCRHTYIVHGTLVSHAQQSYIAPGCSENAHWSVRDTHGQ